MKKMKTVEDIDGYKFKKGDVGAAFSSVEEAKDGHYLMWIFMMESDSVARWLEVKDESLPPAKRLYYAGDTIMNLNDVDTAGPVVIAKTVSLWLKFTPVQIYTKLILTILSAKALERTPPIQYRSRCHCE